MIVDSSDSRADDQRNDVEMMAAVRQEEEEVVAEVGEDEAN